MRCFVSILASLALVSAAIPADAITVADLQKELNGKDKITIIDLREASLFREGHIPGAINIPASLCPLKRLPPLGNVVVYDDGLGRQGAAPLKSAAAALASKPGITVGILKGGYAAWEEAHGLTTRGSGLRPETFNYITYGQLLKVATDDVVLVDLRKLTKAVLKNSDTLTDLSKEFPGRAIASTPAGPSSASPLVVLIDSADGTSEAAARALKARGVRHYAILAGGELAIVRKGRPGLERSGPRSSAVRQHQNQNSPPVAPDK